MELIRCAMENAPSTPTSDARATALPNEDAWDTYYREASRRRRAAGGGRQLREEKRRRRIRERLGIGCLGAAGRRDDVIFYLVLAR